MIYFLKLTGLLNVVYLRKSKEKAGAEMGTEERPAVYIDELKPYAALGYLLNELDAPKAVRKAKGQIHRAVLGIAQRLTSGNGRLTYVGAGTSGRLGVQDGAELWPTFGWPKERFAYLIAGGDTALTQSVEGAEDDSSEAIRLVGELGIDDRDVVIALAASGATPFTVSAMREAKKRGALTIGIANNSGSPLLTESSFPIFLKTGAEPIAGSTRMKAGTAQCVVLKVVSTLVMVRLGYVYRGLMVNVRAVNEKLKKRAVGMVRMITQCDERDATEALEKAKWEVGVAVLLFGDETVQSAEELYFVLCHRNLGSAIVLTELVNATR